MGSSSLLRASFETKTKRKFYRTEEKQIYKELTQNLQKIHFSDLKRYDRNDKIEFFEDFLFIQENNK